MDQERDLDFGLFLPAFNTKLSHSPYNVQLVHSRKTFSSDPLLGFCLEQAELYNIDVCIENEPVCRVHSKTELVSLFNLVQNKRLKLWLDVANLIELNEVIDKDFIERVGDRITCGV